jgi:hypothetical protein
MTYLFLQSNEALPEGSLIRTHRLLFFGASLHSFPIPQAHNYNFQDGIGYK